MTVLCQIYRSPREEGMYLFVRREERLERVPESLLARFGQPQPAMVLPVWPGRKLARVSAERVLECLAEPGYYLQLPPGPEADEEAARVRTGNDKLGR